MTPKERAVLLWDQIHVLRELNSGTLPHGIALQAIASCIAATLAEERERCAKIALDESRGVDQYCCKPLAESIAAAIRAGSEAC